MRIQCIDHFRTTFLNSRAMGKYVTMIRIMQSCHNCPHDYTQAWSARRMHIETTSRGDKTPSYMAS